jgi:glycosyltransferase involved in cell wall biosynthesis
MPLDSPIRVTIGMPVYNGDKTLRPVLESIIGQTYKNFQLVISDNASSDGTENICREFAATDERIRYIRQVRNIGGAANFDFVLAKADTEYFMWAAADDVRSSGFLEKNVDFLDHNPDFLGSTCPVRFEGEQFDPIRMGDQTRDETDPFMRMLNFFQIWHANGRFYSLFRTDVLRTIKAESSIGPFFASDWTLVLELLKKGKLKRIDDGFVVLGRNGLSNSSDTFAACRTRTLCWVLPMVDFSKETIRLFSDAPLSYRLKLLSILAKVNIITFKWQIQAEIKRRSLKSLT